MPLDPNIILSGQKQQFDPTEAMAKAMTMKQLALQTQAQETANQDNQDIRNAYKTNMTADANGNPTFNRAGALSSLSKTNPMAAKQLESQLTDQQAKLDENYRKIGTHYYNQILPDRSNYTQVREQMIADGIPNAKMMPEAPDDKFMGSWRVHLLDPEHQIKHEEVQARIGETKVKRDELNAQKKEKDVNNMVTSLKKDLDPDAGRSGNFGQVSAKVLAADRLNTLINAYKGGDLPPAQMEELALGMANMLNNGNVAGRDQVKALVPHTWYGGAQDAKQWLLNEPQGAGQQAFVSQMAHTIGRERETALDQLNQIRERRLSAHRGLSQKDPEQFKALLKAYEMNPDDYDQNLLRKAPRKKQGPPPEPGAILKTHEIEWAD